MQTALLKKLYESVLRIRMVEEKIAALYPEQEMRCPVHFSIGQEAVAAGVCEALEKDDYVLSSHRSHGHYLAKGGNLNAMLAELYGKATGCTGGRGGSMHLIDLSAGFLGATPIVASTIPIAVGAAFAIMMRREKRVAVAFFGDGAVEEGVCHESINFAVLKKLPVVFVCENNLYSVYSPLSVRQPESRKIYLQVQGHGIESFTLDGNDVGEVYEHAMRAAEKARSGRGPTFLEFSTYRWLEHCGPFYDNDLGYRTEEEFLKWKKTCPVKRIEERLKAEGVLANKDFERVKIKLEKEISEAVNFAKSSPFPDGSDMEEDVFSRKSS